MHHFHLCCVHNECILLLDFGVCSHDATVHLELHSLLCLNHDHDLPCINHRLGAYISPSLYENRLEVTCIFFYMIGGDPTTSPKSSQPINKQSETG